MRTITVSVIGDVKLQQYSVPEGIVFGVGSLYVNTDGTEHLYTSKKQVQQATLAGSPNNLTPLTTYLKNYDTY